MSTGCNVSQDVVLQYNEVKLQRHPFDFRYVTYQIEEGVCLYSHALHTARAAGLRSAGTLQLALAFDAKRG